MISRAPSNSVALRVCCPHATKEHHTINMPPKIFRARIFLRLFNSRSGSSRPDPTGRFRGVDVITQRDFEGSSPRILPRVTRPVPYNRLTQIGVIIGPAFMAITLGTPHGSHS